MLAALLLLISGAAVETPARYTTVFDESLDGKASDARFVESALLAALGAAGLRFVDEAQSRKIRSVTDAGRLIDGTIPTVITSLDADVILAGVVRLTRVESEILGKEAARYSALVQSRAIAVDTGELLGVFSARGTGLDFVVDRAAQKAATDAAEQLARAMIAKLPKTIAPRSFELSIAAIPDVAVGKTLADAVARIDGVDRVDVLHAGRGATKLAVTSARLDAGELALALEEAGAGLTVFGYARRSIRAEYSAARAHRLHLAVAPFEGDRSELAQIAATSLANSPLLTLRSDPRSIALPSAPAALRAALAKHGFDSERTLVMFGRRDRGQIQAKLVAARSGRVITSARARCDQAALSRCAAELGDRLARGLSSAVERRLEPPDRSREKPLAVTWSFSSDLFPSRATAYAKGGLIRLALENRGTQRIGSMRVAAEIPGLTSAPLETAVEALAPKEARTIEVGVVLDQAALARQHLSKPVVVVLRVEYDYDGYRASERLSRAITAFPKNAMSWDEERSIASFVTHGDPAVVERAKQALAAVPSTSSGEPIALPLALFAAMADLSYARDPEHPYSGRTIDHVIFPREVLAERSGDCDDLSVLYAALAEAAGLRALLLTTPGHLLVAIDAELPERNRRSIALDPAWTFIHQGRVFIPVESTRAGSSFREAWRAAAHELAKVDRPGVIDLHEAWQDFPPIDLAAADRSLASTGPADLRQRVEEAVAAEHLAHQAEIEEALRTAASLDERALLLALAERLTEAERAYAETLAKHRTSRRLNNLGNVRLIDGHAKAALEQYASALKETNSVPIHINAALAAWLLGDEEVFTRHIASCLALGGERAVRELAESDLGTLGSLRGGAIAGLAQRDLAQAIEALLVAAKRAPVKRPEIRARRNEESRGILRRYLYWL